MDVVTIPANTTSKAHSVVVNGDDKAEANETFTGSLSSLSAMSRSVAFGATTSATGTITNDDYAPVVVCTVCSDQSVIFGNPITNVSFAVTDADSTSGTVTTSSKFNAGSFAPGLPGGLTLTAGAGPDPLHKTYTLSGNASAPPGVYTVQSPPVTRPTLHSRRSRSRS